MHTFKVGVFDSLDIDEFAFAPESDFGDFVCGRVDAQVNGFSWGGVVYF